MKLKLTLVLAVLCVVVAIGGGLVLFRPGASEAIPSNPGYDRLPSSLCSIEAAVSAGNSARAEALFWNNAHTQIHRLSSDLNARSERRLSATILQAKSAVESSIAPGADPATAELLSELQALRRAVSAGLGALSTATHTTADGCPTSTATAPVAPK